MKKINIYSLILGGVLFFTSCTDFLSLSPVSEVASNGFYTTTEEVEAAVIAIYDGMQAYDDDNDYTNREFALTEMRSDNTKTKSSEGEWAQFESMDVDPTSATISAYWNIQYNVVFRANTVLKYLDVVEDAATRAQFEGEAKFARALSHFNLVRAFGEVPVVESILSPDESLSVVRQPTSEVYSSITADLSSAISLLSSRSEVSEGRATVGAAQALLAKVYLTIGDHGSAKTLLESVMSSSDYSLMDNYNDVFYDELNDEVIFAIQYMQDDALNYEDFSYEFTWKGKASGLNYPTADLMAAVDPLDGRYSTLFYFDIGSGSSGGYECGKFRAVTAANEILGGNDWIVLRYADVLLMYTEAVMGTATSTTDAAAVNAYKAVRARAGYDVSAIASVTKEELLLERRIELAFENHRLYDLIRFGTAETVMSSFSSTDEAGFNFAATDLLLPIPLREQNLNSGLTQNPGY